MRISATRSLRCCRHRANKRDRPGTGAYSYYTNDDLTRNPLVETLLCSSGTWNTASQRDIDILLRSRVRSSFVVSRNWSSTRRVAVSLRWQECIIILLFSAPQAHCQPFRMCLRYSRSDGVGKRDQYGHSEPQSRSE